MIEKKKNKKGKKKQKNKVPSWKRNSGMKKWVKIRNQTEMYDDMW